MTASTGRIVIRGGGEMGSGVAWRLARCGFSVVITEIAQPTAIRRWVCFSEAAYEREYTLEGVTAARVEAPDRIGTVLSTGRIPLLILPDPSELSRLDPDIIVDAILAKRNTGIRRGMARRVIGLGPGFEAGGDVDCVIETNRGPQLGRCLWSGRAEADTGVPGVIAGESAGRVLRAPQDGTVAAVRNIGDRVREGEIVAQVGESEVPAKLGGVVRGLIRPGIQVMAGTKIGDIDPRGEVELCRRVSDKALAIAGGVLEAILTD